MLVYLLDRDDDIRKAHTWNFSSIELKAFRANNSEACCIFFDIFTYTLQILQALKGMIDCLFPLHFLITGSLTYIKMKTHLSICWIFGFGIIFEGKTLSSPGNDSRTVSYSDFKCWEANEIQINSSWTSSDSIKSAEWGSQEDEGKSMLGGTFRRMSEGSTWWGTWKAESSLQCLSTIFDAAMALQHYFNTQLSTI